jgi:HPt (histidine-containing phosphotransfer) domain-containing protein
MENQDNKQIGEKVNRINLDYIKMAADEDQDVALELIDLLCEHIPLMIEEIKLQWTNKNSLQLKQSAHKIKPTIALLKIPAFLQIIESIELNAAKGSDWELIDKLVEDVLISSSDIIEQLKTEQQKLRNAA